MKDIYEKKFVLSARRQKLAIEKLEKEIFKIYNIKPFWQHSRDLGLNSKANTSAFELTKSSKSALGKKKISAYFFFYVIQKRTEILVLL